MKNKTPDLAKTQVSNPQKQDTRGSILKKAREEKGLSLETVHEVTKVPLDALRAIEEGYTIRTLSPFYVNGFIKIYAQYLGVETPEQAPEILKEKKKESVIQQAIKQQDFFDDFDLRQWISKHFTAKRKRQLIIVVGALLAFWLIFKVFSWVSHRVTRSKTGKSEINTVRNVEQAPPAPVPAAIATAPIESVKSQTQETKTPIVVPIDKNVVLTVRAKKDSWLSVKTDDVIVFQSSLREGSVETWVADKEIEISGRNINQLEFELNGEMIKTGRTDRRTKKVTVTKDGLSVSK